MVGLAKAHTQLFLWHRLQAGLQDLAISGTDFCPCHRINRIFGDSTHTVNNILYKLWFYWCPPWYYFLFNPTVVRRYSLGDQLWQGASVVRQTFRSLFQNRVANKLDNYLASHQLMFLEMLTRRVCIWKH